MPADIISTTNVWPNYSASNVGTAARKEPSDTMGKDQFLKILITQLQNQNPMQPMEDKEFIAQMAQFTSVEQLSNISGQLQSLSQSLGAVSGLIGKQVSWIGKIEGSNETEVQSGIVDSIIIRDQVQYAVIDDMEVALTDITQISDVNTEDKVPETETNPDDSAPENGKEESSGADGAEA
ncbi:flagellar hook capping FlgD N-terminal domain-containing protein [Paenibacillus sp. Marseille-Q4541]|uniref:flagellar hook capping FlgD N-terminal domain-containing protein n=1 Tax=Paenibacillus sp. Marseille-Q4541 TaxID=2831522 RepID=UPI001BA97B31|nr:flagellar hook capping FlgD N-terminal domain-containing protein [Paenibacillus sp. Marseille-Q4541]